MSDVFFEILSPLPLNRRQDARKLFELWAENANNFLPDRWGLYGPLRHSFSMSSLDEAIRAWEFYFLVKRIASPKLEGSIAMQYGPHREHSVELISLDIKDFDQLVFCNLLQRSAAAFSANFRSLSTPSQRQRRQEAGSTAQSAFWIWLRLKRTCTFASPMLEKCLPDIYWTTVFGRPYVELFSRERLLSCPAHRIKELDSGVIIIQLTPELKDIAAEEAAFERVRQDARNHLNNDAFFDPAEGAGLSIPSPPESVWGPILH